MQVVLERNYFVKKGFQLVDLMQDIKAKIMLLLDNIQTQIFQVKDSQLHMYPLYMHG